ncbi:MAG: J domain-containing protein [Bdellovibrionaceae bacterium]|nr:J domain-containing protein [Pseudobdellovibrionaceae bacterium]
MNLQSFQQILTEKLAGTEVPKGPISTPSSETLKQTKQAIGKDNMAFLLGRIQPLKPSNSQLNRYPRPPRRPHSLNESQSHALCYFNANGAMLPPDLTAPELKAAYRALARRFHPDKKGGSQASFIELKLSYDSLKSLFTGCF